MPISVENSGSTIRIDNGNEIVNPYKDKVFVTSRGSLVKIGWDNIHYIECPYTEFTSPAGANAEAVATAIEVFLDTNPTVDILETLKNNLYEVAYYETITAATGTITKPTNATIITDTFPQALDALVETIINGRPSGLSATDSSGDIIFVNSFNAANGAYTLSGTPTAAVAFIYLLRIKAIDWGNLNTAKIIDWEDVVSDPIYSAIASGTNTYTATLSSVSAYSSVEKYFIKFTLANTAASTLNINGLGAIAIKKNVSEALIANDINAGQILTLAYDGANFQIIGSKETGAVDSTGITVDGQGSVVIAASYGFKTYPFASTIAKWYVNADQSGSIQFDIKRNGTSIIGAGNKPLLSAQQNNSGVPASWTSDAITAEDILEFVVDSASTITRATLTLKLT